MELKGKVFMSGSFPQLDIEEVLRCINNSIEIAKTEEDLRVRASACIEERILKPLGIHQVGRYEYTLVSGARVDALYGHVIIEYKAPGKLSSKPDIERAKEQVIKYIKGEARDKCEWPRYLGVIISDKIAFIKYDPRAETWILRGPYDIRREVIVKLIEALRGLRRKPLNVENLVNDFGPKSQLAGRAVRAFYNKLHHARKEKTKILFDDWMRLYSQATGYDPSKLKELSKLAEEYGLHGSVDYNKLLFAIHTYYAFIMKLLAAEVAYLYGSGKFYKSYIAELDDAYSRAGVEGLRDVLNELESGGIFKKLLGIENFIEGDYFSWYLDELDEELAEVIAQIARRLSDYEIATPQLEPEFARDLLKKLYQNLIPGDLRHHLGEYYTPDWLAELILDEVGLSLENLLKMGEENPLKPLEIRILDPSCGSGTFLVLYISRLRRYAEEHFLTDQLASYIINNVVGFDLNPLAVLAARTNYLLAIADLLTYARGVRALEIPIYLADSVMIEKRAQLAGENYVLRTVVGEFIIPKKVVENGHLHEILAEIPQALRSEYSEEDFKRRLKYLGVTNENVKLLVNLYKKLLELEREGKDEIWISILRNAFAPLLKGKFDYVVGNPPWINWESLPEKYRQVSMELWSRYGLAQIKGKTGLGKVKRDLAMLFLARCYDLYLKPGGKLGFLLPFTVFKTGAGAGFREFLARKTKIHIIHDLVTLYPFEGATNRTGAIVVEKPCELRDIDEGKCPSIENIYKANISGVRHVIWVGKQIPTDIRLEDVLKTTRRDELIMAPLEPTYPASQWMQATPRALNIIRRIISGPQYYEAHAGITTGLNQVYYVKIVEKTPDGALIITNPPESGQKKRVKQITTKIEADLVYPLVRGRDIEKWCVRFSDRYIIVPHVPSTAEPIRESELKTKLPLTYQYLANYREELENRSIHKLWGRNKPFYTIYDIGPYTFKPYKVVWKRISGEITGKAVSFECAVVEPINGKPVIPDDSTIMIGFENPEEAYYVAGVLNSVLARAIIASYTYELRQETHIVDVIKIPRFDPQNSLHQRIAELSRRAHELATCIHGARKCSGDPAAELRSIEKELDKAVAELYGITEDELRELERLLAILSGEEIPEEEETITQMEPRVVVPSTLIPPMSESYIEVEVVNPSGEEIEFVYEFPWSKGSFRIVDGKYAIQVPPLEDNWDSMCGTPNRDYKNSCASIQPTLNTVNIHSWRNKKLLFLKVTQQRLMAVDYFHIMEIENYENWCYGKLGK